MEEYEYILEVGRENIDIINKITEAYEGIGNVRTIDKKRGLIKILTISYFLDDLDEMLEKIKKKFNINIKIVSKEEWQGVI
ncbi:DUF4911 domain-containing protein [Sneathia sanguinegens]|jgi:hypothetical protein|uniref:DUF4911 domain-containing protein n=1 Tax=Sneathia sanguinegens TaxID=40543 RepID=UPI000831DB31|nr:DUF4911 domain-containing protein [Sneathia sanguinegens]MDU4652260.1 DUF4911 domain-containing protein [Sneathia sanguinegens]MDU7496686.1 DUF4911 domain-containing protein [Sneathia sanguinegens]